MKADKNVINELFCKDIILIVVFTVLAICTMLLVLMQVLAITEGSIRNVIIIVALVSILFLFWAALEVIFHLRRQRTAVYTEELKNQELLHQHMGDK